MIFAPVLLHLNIPTLLEFGDPADSSPKRMIRVCTISLPSEDKTSKAYSESGFFWRKKSPSLHFARLHTILYFVTHSLKGTQNRHPALLPAVASCYFRNEIAALAGKALETTLELARCRLSARP